MGKIRDKLKDMAKLHSDDSVVTKQGATQNDNERADAFRGMWLEQRDSLIIEQKDAIAFSYLKNVVADWETAEKFVHGDMDADYRVGDVHSGSKEGTKDYFSFWSEVSNITSGYSEDDVVWLSKVGGYYGVSEMMFTIEPASIEVSPIMRQIRTNMHAYK
ncbi:MAG: hypothetical protein HZB68_04335 [Candidatus Aenigmarchaeota archaeon]|nr:hypothetical protein [Candidatus Aenigmarchaeota archaeon]